MSGDDDKPVSSEELIRRAREAAAHGADVPADVESEPPTAEPSEMAAARPDPTAGPPEDATPGPDVLQEPQSAWATVWQWGRWIVPVVATAWVVFSIVTAGEPVESLDIGACFMEQPGEEISGVDTIDCAESHDLELFAKIEITGFGEEYPGDDALAQWLGEACSQQFEDYVGFNFLASDYWVYTITPALEVWEDGEYLGLCALYLGDFAGNILSSTGSARNAGH